MPLVVKDDIVQVDRIFGPLPDFEEPFERFFIQKALEQVTSQPGAYLNNSKSHITNSDITHTDTRWKYVVRQ